MTRFLHACGHLHECDAVNPGIGVTDEQWEAYSLEMGWYEDEDRMGYEQGHVCCPDCGCDKNDHTCHAEGCPRVDTPVQCGPPWLPLVASR